MWGVKGGFHYNIVCVCVFLMRFFLLLCISSAWGYFPFNPHHMVFFFLAEWERFWWMNTIKIFIAFQHPPTTHFIISYWVKNKLIFVIFYFSWSSISSYYLILLFTFNFVEWAQKRTFSIIQWCFHLVWGMIKLMFKFFFLGKKCYKSGLYFEMMKRRRKREKKGKEEIYYVGHNSSLLFFKRIFIFENSSRVCP